MTLDPDHMAAVEREQQRRADAALADEVMAEVRSPRLVYDCGTKQAGIAAVVLWLLSGRTFEVYPSWLVPGRAVWTWNGEPMEPA